MDDGVDVTVRLELGSGVPSGVVLVAGASWRFRGWLELLRCMEDARSGCTSRAESAAGDE
jgi:hypothetical protein